VHLNGGIAIRWGLDEDVIDHVAISTLPVVIGAGSSAADLKRKPGRWPRLVSFPSGLVEAHYDRKR
jgi:hypothetical protein